MEKAKDMVYSVFEALGFCADSVKVGVYEMSEFSVIFDKAQRIISEDTSFLPLSSELSIILHRAKILFCALADAALSLENTDNSAVTEYFFECTRVSESTFLLFGCLFKKNNDFEEYTEKRNILCAKVEELRHYSKTLRFSLLSGQKKIFTLLPVLEKIYMYTDILEKCEKLCTAFDSVNNKFTLFT